MGGGCGGADGPRGARPGPRWGVLASQGALPGGGRAPPAGGTIVSPRALPEREPFRKRTDEPVCQRTVLQGLTQTQKALKRDRLGCRWPSRGPRGARLGGTGRAVARGPTGLSRRRGWLATGAPDTDAPASVLPAAPRTTPVLTRAPLHDSGLRPGPGPAAHGGPRGTWLHLPGTRGQIAPAPTRPASQTPAPRWCSGRGPVPGGLRVLVPRTDRQMGPGPRSTHRGEARQTGNADALCPRPRRRLAGARRPRRGQADMRGVCVQWPVYPNTTGPSQLRARTAAPESSGEHLISFAAAFLECSPYTKETTHTGQMPAVKEKNAGLGTRRRSGAV